MIKRELNKHAYDEIRRRILDGEFPPSSPLSEYQLAASLNLSRTPVREAVKQLEKEGLVWSVPNKGTFVAELTAHDIMEIYQVRERLEGLAARVAAEQMPEEEIRQLEKEIALANELEAAGKINEVLQCDIRLHRLIVAAPQNARLCAILSNLEDQMYRVRSIFTQSPEWLSLTMHDHALIVQKIRERDGAGAETAMARHLRSACERAVQTVMPLRRGA